MLNSMLAKISLNGGGKVARLKSYERAIRKSNDFESICMFGALLMKGENGVEKKIRWASSLFESAIEQRGHV